MSRPTPTEKPTVVPCVSEPGSIATLVEKGGGLPLNVMFVPGLPPPSELSSLGVARLSLGTALAQTALATTRAALREIFRRGSLECVASPELSYAEMNGLFRRR